MFNLVVAMLARRQGDSYPRSFYLVSFLLFFWSIAYLGACISWWWILALVVVFGLAVSIRLLCPGGTDAPAPTTPDAAAGGVGDDDGGGSVGGDADVSAAREIPPVFSNDDISTSSDQDATSSMSNNLT